MKCNDIPLEKFKIDIFYPQGKTFEERKKNIENSFDQIIDEYIIENLKEL